MHNSILFKSIGKVILQNIFHKFFETTQYTTWNWRDYMRRCEAAASGRQEARGAAEFKSKNNFVGL